MNQKGFTLGEVLVSAVIMSIVSVGIFATIRGLTNGSATAETRISLSSNVVLLQKMLSNLQICTNGIDKTSAVPIDFAAPARFDVSFNIIGFGLIKRNTDNTTINFFIDEVYVDSPIFYGLSATNQKIFIGILKMSATQKIQENGVTKRGLNYKERIVGAFTITLADDKTIVDCKTSPRSL